MSSILPTVNLLVPTPVYSYGFLKYLSLEALMASFFGGVGGAREGSGVEFWVLSDEAEEPL